MTALTSALTFIVWRSFNFNRCWIYYTKWSFFCTVYRSLKECVHVLYVFVCAAGSKLRARVISTLTSWVLQLPNFSHASLQQDQTHRRTSTHADSQTSARKQTIWSTQICTEDTNYGDTCVRMWIWWLQASCCPFHVVERQHSTRYHFTGMRSVYDFFMSIKENILINSGRVRVCPGL